MSPPQEIVPGVEGVDRKLLVIDSSYTYQMICERGLQKSVICRDLDGFFGHVWTVHPFSSMLTSEDWGQRYGRPRFHPINPRHTFIEGMVGRFQALRGFPFTNFLLGQVGLFITLWRLIRSEKISVIRTGSPLYIGLLAWALARLTGIPFLIRVGGNHDKLYETTGRPMEPRLMRSRSIEKKVERFIFPRADLVAGANQDNLDFALDNGARPERATIFRYGNLIDDDHFKHPAERSLNPELLRQVGVTPKGFILYIGRLEALKHPDDVIRTVAELHQRGHKLKGVLVGDGKMRPELERLAQELGVAEDIVFPGNRSQAWLSQIIPQAAAVVSPHTGRALTEAALGGIPITAYDLDWQGELIESGVTGELVPHGHWLGFADAVERFLTDENYGRALGQAVRRKTLEMLDPESLDDHERAEYTKLIMRHR